MLCAWMVSIPLNSGFLIHVTAKYGVEVPAPGEFAATIADLQGLLHKLTLFHHPVGRKISELVQYHFFQQVRSSRRPEDVEKRRQVERQGSVKLCRVVGRIFVAVNKQPARVQDAMKDRKSVG